jgi:hypothetical protein
MIGFTYLSVRKIRLVIKSPQFGIILSKGADQDQERSQETAKYQSLFLEIPHFQGILEKLD